MAETSYTIKSRLGPADFIGLRLLLMYSGWRRYFWPLALAAGIALVFIYHNYVLLIVVGAYLVLVNGLVIAAALVRRNRDLYQEKTITLDSQYFAFKSPKYDERIDWQKGISRRQKVGPYYLVFLLTGGFVVIPQRDIPQNIREGFIGLLESKTTT